MSGQLETRPVKGDLSGIDQAAARARFVTAVRSSAGVWLSIQRLPVSTTIAYASADARRGSDQAA